VTDCSIRPERVCRKLRRVGLLTRRQGSAGNGLLFDHATKLLLHDIAKGYGCAGWSRGENIPAALCAMKKQHDLCKLCKLWMFLTEPEHRYDHLGGPYI